MHWVPDFDHLLVLPEDWPEEDLAGLDFIKVRYLHQPSILSTTGNDMENILKKFMLKAKETITGTKELALVSSIESNVANEEQFTPPVTPIRNEVENLERPALFYRYVRPTDWGNHGTAGPCGGICFKIDLNPAENKFTFSYSLCSLNDHFNFRIARNIATQRMDSGDSYVVVQYNPALSVVDNIYEALDCSLIEAKVGSRPYFETLSYRFTKQNMELLLEKLRMFV